MPSFLKDLSLRRKSKASFRESDDNANSANGTNVSSENSSTVGGNDGLRQQQRNKSSSTLNSYLDRRNSPPTPLSSPHSRSQTTLPGTNGSSNPKTTPPPVPARPRLPSSQSNRYSMLGLTAQSGERNMSMSSPLAPRVLSVSDGSWVHQKVLLIFGTCADPNQPIDGQLTVNHHQDNFPATNWPVNDSHFKALVHLQPGPNRLRLDFTSPKLPAPISSNPAHSTYININYLPFISAPPIQMCILVAKDSPMTYDAVPQRIEKEGNNLETAIRKFRMAAYLWQAFTAEQMQRNGFGRRVYRYEEEWQPGTLSWKDFESGQMRNEAKIHVIRMKQTVAEIRDLDIAQQYEAGERRGDLFGMASDAVRDYFKPGPGQTQYVSAMYLDTHWDKQIGTVRGHAALGGGGSDIRLAIFGSHALQSYPAHLEEVAPAFSDCTRTDTDFVANDCGESGSNWEAANIGIGAHLHETGHLLGCPHQESGVMLRDYVTLNRTFTTREPYSTRTKSPGMRLCLPKDECAWHRLDTLRFRFHPCFQDPNDQPNNALDPTIQTWAVDNGNVLVTAVSGVAWVEIKPEGDEECHHWIEFFSEGTPPPKQIMLSEQQLRERLPQDKKKSPKINIKVFSCGGADSEVDDFAQLASKTNRLSLPDGRNAFRGAKLGFSQMDGSRPQDVLIGSMPKKAKNPRLLTSIRVHCGDCIDGLEFFYEDGGSDLFGQRGGSPHDFALDTRRGESLLGFYVRAGLWIDGIQILTSSGRRSEIFGKKDGGSGYTLIPPRGYAIAGVYGSSGAWVDGFGLIITR